MKTISRYSWLFPAVLILFLMLITSSCKTKYLGYGVLLWSPNEKIVPTGTVLPILSESKLNDSYSVRKDSSKTEFEFPKWRIQVFETKEKATKAANTFIEFKTIFARNLKDGLLIRSKEDAASLRVYKMKKNQNIKIIGRSATMAEVGQYTGYWYKVLTADGIAGYCFDHYLDIYDSSVPPEKQINPAQKLLDTAFKKNYHPQNFISMIKNSTIILSSFKPQIGLFPDPVNKTVTVTTPSYSLRYTWSKPILIDKRSFETGDNGLLVSVISDTHVSVSYHYKGQKVTSEYYVIENMEDIISNEMDRRQILYEALEGKGAAYDSAAYGTINFLNNRIFIWTNYSRLVPQIIPADAGNRGKVYFDNFISPDLHLKNTSILTFTFDSGSNNKTIYFLYTLAEGKLKLTLIPESYVQKHLVTRLPTSPLILSFQVQ